MKIQLTPHPAGIDAWLRFYTYFTSVMWFASAAFFIAALVASRFHVWGWSAAEEASLHQTPTPEIFLFAGLGGFCFFFAWSIALSFSRTFRSEIARLEAKIDAMSDKNKA